MSGSFNPLTFAKNYENWLGVDNAGAVTKGCRFLTLA